MRYLLPCECGRKIPLAATHAGEEVVCECGRAHTAPKLRELRQLEPFHEDSAAPPRREWSGRQGVLFVLGALLLIFSVLALVYTALQRNNLFTERPVRNEELVTQHLGEIDTNTPVENLQVWQEEILGEGLSRPGEPMHLVHRRMDEMLARRLVILGATAVVGAALIVTSLLLRGPRKA